MKRIGHGDGLVIPPVSERQTDAPASISSEAISILATDGYRLAGDLISQVEGGGVTRVAMINAGAGLRRKFYRPFAEYLAKAGIPTVIYDYRGIGGSRPAKLRGFSATVEEWGSKDCASVLYWLSERFPGAKRIVVGHSVGALVTGFVTNGQLIDELIFIGAHTGYWRDYQRKLRLVMYVTWHLFMPAVTHTAGYFPGRALRLGDDLPAGVALDWAARTKPEIWLRARGKSGALDHARIADLKQRFAAIRAPIVSIRFSDDAFSTMAASARLCELFVNCVAEHIVVEPREIGTRRGGHFRFFDRQLAHPIWASLLDPVVASERRTNR